MRKTFLIVALILALALGGCASNGGEKNKVIDFTNVSYDPTREFYGEYNKIFVEKQKAKGVEVEVTQSHGGSGSQAISVCQGLEADVVTLALEGDVQAISEAGLIDAGWIDEFEGSSAPYTSTIVFLVRAGNPKGIADWDDLTKDGVGVITPNPKTSGGARWNFLAAWAFGEEKWSDEAEIREFVKKLYKNVLVLDSGARGSTTSFVENKQGDVLIAWENEAYLTLKQYPDQYEIITPGISILCQPSVAVVDAVAKKHATEELAKEYLQGLYSDEAQKLAAKYFYRPSNKKILEENADTFNLDVKLTDIEHFGGWPEAQKRFFSDGGVFDSIYDR